MTSNDVSIPGWSPEDLEAANDLIISDIGRQAAEQGWILSLWDFCRCEHRLPEADEIDAVKAKGHLIDAAVLSSEDCHPSIVRLGESIERRRREMSERVLSWGQA